MFIGREKELRILKNKIQSNNFEFGIVYGRRRIGKTKLLQELVKDHNAIYYVANEMGYENNLEQLSRTVANYFNQPFTFSSFEDLFRFVGQKSFEDELILIIDEFTYLMSSNEEILSVLQNIIDHTLLDTKLKLIISGSHVGMLEDAISYKKPLYGRSTFKLKIEPFDYYDASKFYPNASVEEKIMYYSVFGGVPFYTNRINDKLTFKENVVTLLIEEGSMFEDEVTFFLSQEVRSVATYGKVLNAIASGATRVNEISTKSGISDTGNTSKHLDLLIQIGIVEKIYGFGERVNSRKSMYKIKDQLFLFNYRFIERFRSQRTIMDPNKFYNTYIEPHLDEFVSFEFERISMEFLLRKHANDIQEISSYWYNDAKLKKDIEIDIVMRKKDELFAFECKWTNKTINIKIAEKLREKTLHLKEDVIIGFFSKSGYENNINQRVLSFSLKDLYNF